MAHEMTPLIITATPNKSWLNPELPYPQAIDDVAAESARCVANGASILHLHSITDWIPLIAAVRSVAGDALIQCGMSSLLLDERMDIYGQGADMISIIASHHAEAFPEGDVDVLHPMAELLRYCQLCTENDVRPEFEIWHSGSIWNLQYLLDHAELVRPVINTVFFGWPGGTWSPPTIEEYLARRKLMPPDCVVTVSVMGPERYGILAAAITTGDHVRVGTEDYGRDRWGQPAQASDQVAELAALAEALGRPVATPDEARKMLAFGPARQ